MIKNRQPGYRTPNAILKDEDMPQYGKITALLALLLAVLLFITILPRSYHYFIPATEAHDNPPVIDVSNFMNGGTYPITPTNPLWLTTNNGYVPVNGAIYRNINGVTTYHCRVYYQNDFYDGELVPGKGCDVPSGKSILRFNLYDVLLNPYPQ